jgi:hypothetical protein
MIFKAPWTSDRYLHELKTRDKHKLQQVIKLEINKI